MTTKESSMKDIEYNDFLKIYFTPSILQFVGRSFLSTIMSLILSIIAAIYWNESLVITWLYVFFAVIIFSVNLRYQENLVHSGSHYCVSNNHIVNDILVNIFSGLQVAQQVKEYRLSHSMHHSYFGSEGDPCKARYKNQDKPFRNMISMTFSFYKQISLHKITTIITALYYIGLCTLIGQLVSAEVALKFALIALLSFFFVLPVIRYIAEMAEHDYTLSDTELGSTFNNLSFIDRWLFHPAADGYHLLHHLYPAIPFWNHKKAHKYLMERDCKYRNGFHRTSSLDKVKSLLGENR